MVNKRIYTEDVWLDLCANLLQSKSVREAAKKVPELNSEAGIRAAQNFVKNEGEEVERLTKIVQEMTPKAAPQFDPGTIEGSLEKTAEELQETLDRGWYWRTYANGKKVKMTLTPADQMKICDKLVAINKHLRGPVSVRDEVSEAEQKDRPSNTERKEKMHFAGSLLSMHFDDNYENENEKFKASGLTWQEYQALLVKQGVWDMQGNEYEGKDKDGNTVTYYLGSLTPKYKAQRDRANFVLCRVGDAAGPADLRTYDDKLEYDRLTEVAKAKAEKKLGSKNEDSPVSVPRPRGSMGMQLNIAAEKAKKIKRKTTKR